MPIIMFFIKKVCFAHLAVEIRQIVFFVKPILGYNISTEFELKSNADSIIHQ